VTVVERASSHILQGQKIIKEEYEKYNVNGRLLPLTYVNGSLKEYEEADYILVPSEYAKRSFLERGFDPERIIKIPFGVDVQKFKIPNPKSQIPNKSQILNHNFQNMNNRGSGRFVVLYVGEVRLGKGVQYLLEAWDRLNLRDAELWVVGEVKPSIKKITREQKNKRTARFLGFRKDVAELMGRADVLAFPSLDEGSARVTYEAMAAGLPVITTPNAGSLVRDSLDGYIIPIRDSDALAERLEFFYKYPKQGRRMGESGRERISQFTWERYGEELVKAYIRMLR
jgi:glycosyltransferase involved in cell wall biosynthesis